MMTLDEWYEKYLWKHVYLWDQTYDQSHLHHLVFTSLVFGPIGMVFCLLLNRWDFDLMWTSGYTTGILGGWLAYTYREIKVRVILYLKGRAVRLIEGNGKWPEHTPFYNWWDGLLDVFFQVVMTGVMVHQVLWHTLSPHSVQAYVLGIMFLLYAYTIGRPNNTLHYDTNLNLKIPR